MRQPRSASFALGLICPSRSGTQEKTPTIAEYSFAGTASARVGCTKLCLGLLIFLLILLLLGVLKRPQLAGWVQTVDPHNESSPCHDACRSSPLNTLVKSHVNVGFDEGRCLGLFSRLRFGALLGYAGDSRRACCLSFEGPLLRLPRPPQVWSI